MPLVYPRASRVYWTTYRDPIKASFGEFIRRSVVEDAEQPVVRTTRRPCKSDLVVATHRPLHRFHIPPPLNAGGGAARTACKTAAGGVPASAVSLTEFPADDPERARRFWVGFLGVEMEVRRAGEEEGWQTHSGAPEVGVHARGRGPGDSFSLPYFAVPDVADALERVEALGGTVVHPGEAWAICKDSEGSPFGLARQGVGG